jgi:SSS family solute:Na+ symporter
LVTVLPGIIAFDLFADKLQSQDQAYGALVQPVLPWYLNGFFTAVMVGAILSSFNSALNSCATLFSLNVSQTMIRPEADEKQTIRVGKWFGWSVAAVIAPLLVDAGGIFHTFRR